MKWLQKNNYKTMKSKNGEQNVEFNIRRVKKIWKKLQDN